jgi:hypothetical protein
MARPSIENGGCHHGPQVFPKLPDGLDRVLGQCTAADDNARFTLYPDA